MIDSSDDLDQETHVDEKWLVSYADMMTLLFGLFVLLFSMSTLDKKAMGRINSSLSETFGAEKEEADLQKQLTEALGSRDSLVTQLTALRADNDTFLKKIQTLEQIPDEKRSEQQEQLQEFQQELAKQIRDKKNLERNLAKARLENQDLMNKIAKSKKGNSAGSIAKQSGGVKQSFMAMFISWPTKDHDIDLIVEDPKGHTFDFKNRDHNGASGKFTLDTRRGPGAELWQSDRIIPGKYRVSFVLYNDYGNEDAAPISGSLYTPSGNIEFPKVKLDQTKRRATFEFEIGADGAVVSKPKTVDGTGLNRGL